MSEDALNGRQREIFDKANQAYQDKDYAQAASLLEKIYSEVQNSQINHLLVESLYLNEEYSRARAYADDFLNSYLTTATNFRFLLTLLLRVHEFILAHEIVAGVSDAELKQTGSDMITGAEQEARTATAATLATIAKQFYHMSDYSAAEQQARFQAALKLPLNEFKKGAQYLLVDPYLHPLFVVSILEVLQRVKETTPVTFQWLDNQRYTVVPNDLVPLQANKTYLEVQGTLSQKLASKDPVAFNLLTQEVRLQLTLTYPFVDRVVTDATGWVDNLIDVYQGKTSEKVSAVSQWQSRLEQLTAELLSNDN